MKLKNIFHNILLTMMILSLAAGCSSADGVNSPARPGSTAEAAVDDNNKELSIAYYEHSDRMVDAAITEYGSKHPDINIKRERFEYKDDNYQETQKEIESLLTRTLAGDGPDIVVELSYFKIAKNYKTFNSGLYCDLNELIKNDNEFKLDDYYKNVLDTGIINGKRYVIPLAFAVNGFITTKETLKNNMIEIDKTNWSWNDFMQVVRNFMEKNNGHEKYLLNPTFNYNVLKYFVSSRVDDTDNKSHFNTEEFKKLIKDLKEINPAVYPVEKDNGWTYSPHLYIKDEKAVLALDTYNDISNVSQLSGLYDMFKKELGQELVVLPFPQIGEGAGYPFGINITVGITSTCKYEKNAFEFVKILLKPEINGDSFLNSMGLPVSRAGFEKIMNGELPIQKGGGFPHPKENLDEIGKMVNNLGTGKFDDEQIRSIVYGHFISYLDGKETLDEAVKKMDGDTYFYLNE